MTKTFSSAREALDFIDELAKKKISGKLNSKILKQYVYKPWEVEWRVSY